MNSHQIILLIFIGYIVFAIDKKKEKFPAPMVLLLIGIAISFIPYMSGLHVTKELIFNWFLPALLFVSAYQFPIAHLKRHFGVISTLGTIGLILTSFFLGFIIYFVSGFFFALSFLESLLLAIILTPTDPVSAIPILKKASKSTEISDVVEGESMLNDGTSLVLFSVITGILFSDKSFSFLSFVSEFFLVSLGGILIGIIFGWVVLKGLHLTDHFQYQVMISITLAYGSFYIAEYLHVSGVLASVSAGIIFSWKLSRSDKESTFRQSLDGFWEVIEPTILSLVFLLIGIQATAYLNLDYWVLTLMIFGAALVARFIILLGILKSIPYWKKRYMIKDISLITWSGIKGTMSIIFILSLQANYNSLEDLIISLSFGVVLLSLVLQSMLVYPLSKKLQNRK